GRHPAANALRLGFFGGRGLLGLGVRVVLAADQLDLRDLGAVAAAITELQDPRVAAGPPLEARRGRVEKLPHAPAVMVSPQPQAAGGKGLAVVGPPRHATLGDADDPLDEGPQLLRPRDRGLDPLVLQQRVCLIAQHRDAVLGDPSQFPVCYSMTHFFIPLRCRGSRFAARGFAARSRWYSVGNTPLGSTPVASGY